MGQGLTGAAGTYSKLKDLVMEPIPAPCPEPALAVQTKTQYVVEWPTYDHFFKAITMIQEVPRLFGKEGERDLRSRSGNQVAEQLGITEDSIYAT
ncbi:hypothetical protein Asppvi_002307 [Aspergillus pseudoviridinutans]|uniref:Uncharacterized protein n=1 Tax=Aspergillus pseudoviridinutans TaxID=1517512 RepID=A0A9P3ESA0_9EURO|nr:uncharacterized protein Asppvi_002307 [Aspergillus pseudoviridinutans]GIJ83485.1 hypothetical protein Asppvi_002307 [Aspergillus pseudoviridinutans]